MEDNTSKSEKGSISDRGAMFMLGGMTVAFLAMVYYGVTLIILASAITLGSIAVGVFLILRSHSTGDTKIQAVSGEIEQMSNDASFDISEELIVWDKIKYTKGIGTRIAGQESDIENIHHRLVVAREELAEADTSLHRIEAVLTADSVLATAQELRAPTISGEQTQ